MFHITFPMISRVIIVKFTDKLGPNLYLFILVLTGNFRGATEKTDQPAEGNAVYERESRNTPASAKLQWEY